MGDETGKKPPAGKPAAPSAKTVKVVPQAKPVAGKPVAAAKPVAAKPVAATPLTGDTVVAKPSKTAAVSAKPVAAKAVAAQAVPAQAVPAKAVAAKAVAAKPVAQAIAAAPAGAKPVKKAPINTEPERRPGSVTLFGVLNLLFGTLGACFGALLLIGVSLGGEAVAKAAQESGVSGEAASFAMTWLKIYGGVSLVACTVLFVSGIGLLTTKPWGRTLTVGWCLCFLIWAVIASAVQFLMVLRPTSGDGGVAMGDVVGAFFALTISVCYPLLLLFIVMRPRARAAFMGISLEELNEGSTSMGDWIKTTPGWVSSAVVHATLLLMLGLLTLEEKIKEIVPDLTALTETKTENVEELPSEEPTPEVQLDQEVNDVESVDAPDVNNEQQEATDINNALDEPAPAPNIETADFSPIQVPTSSLNSSVTGIGTGNGLGGRTGSARKGLVATQGGSVQSEEGVARGLKWLAAHQNPDGSWNFEHNKGACQGRCGNNGKVTNGLNGATALALLPFLGAGETHKEGKYAKTVQAGLAYLVNNMKVDQATGGSLMDGGTMYSHGLASICLCEAYAMTQDRNLMMPAQQVVNFITYAQDKVGGGWRYSPGQAGDTSVVGWQLMALKSAHMGYLNVPPNVIKQAENFLNTVQVDGGAGYGYTGPGPGVGNAPATTAIGLLCRMYLGWKKDNPALQRGIQRLSQTGPNKTNMYYNYYATQVMHHIGGDEWTKWNGVMRDFLVDTQERDGHLEGSWFMNDGHSAEAGGRLYCTALSTMTLEVYYRFLPLYSETAGAGEFEEGAPQGEAPAEEPGKKKK